ncbi:MAG: histidine kinase [Actinomycetota bacterium]
MDAKIRTASSPRASLLPDAVLAVGLAVFSVIGTYFASQQAHPIRRPFDAGAAILVVISSLALVARRRRPLLVVAVVFTATLTYFLIGYEDGPVWIPLVIAYFTAAVRAHRLAVGITAVTGFALFPWLDFLVRDGPAPSAVSLLALAAWLLVLFGTAEIVRIRRERVAEAVRMEEEEALRRAGEERLRIARELHDALGHQLSLISIQSGVALHLNEALPEQARTSLTAIKEASKEALTELRSVLHILRQEGEMAPRFPGSTLARVDDLVEQAAKAGLDVRTESEGEGRPLPFGVEAAAFRIVQEALTNVTRHAGRATATVRVTYGDRDLVVQVDDDGRGSAPSDTSGSGTGIVGMRERVTTLGGELEAGPRPEGGFRVRARLPVDGAP